jgi:hypothetical protein
MARKGNQHRGLFERLKGPISGGLVTRGRIIASIWNAAGPRPRPAGCSRGARPKSPMVRGRRLTATEFKR